MPLLRPAVFILLALAITGCSTKAFFKLPENSTVAINERAEQHPQGLVKIRPFFWNRAGGVPYKLTSTTTGQPISEGKLSTRFAWYRSSGHRTASSTGRWVSVTRAMT